MTETRYGNIPHFADGQILSAGAHLNALQNVVQALGDDYIGIQLPFHGNGWTGGNPDSWGFARQWIGAIRHKKNRIDWRLEIFGVGAGGEVALYYNNHEITGSRQSTVGVFEALSQDISSFALTVNEFYEVWVVATGEIVWSLELFCESAADEIPPYIIPFADGVTPTAEQWQALADTAAILVSRSNSPAHCIMRTTDGAGWGGRAGGMHMRGMLNHRCRYLAYCVHVSAATRGPGGNPEDQFAVHWTEARIYINHVLMFRGRAGHGGFTPDPFNIFYDAYQGDFNFYGTLDLNTHLASETGLVFGQDYLLEIEIAYSADQYEMIATGGIFYLYEFSEIGTLPANWLPFSKWQHPNYVMGDTGTPHVDTLRLNLELLNNVVHYRNYPTPKITDAASMKRFGLSGVRRRRYLHYRIRFELNPAYANIPEWTPDPNPVPIGYDGRGNPIYPWQGPPGYAFDDEHGYSPEQAKAGRLRFYVNGQTLTTSLDNPYQHWGVLDMDSVDLLEYGVQYYLDDVRYAIEDDDP